MYGLDRRMCRLFTMCSTSRLSSCQLSLLLLLFVMIVLYQVVGCLSSSIAKYFYLPQGCRLASPTPIMASGIRIAASIAIVVMSIVCYPLFLVALYVTIIYILSSFVNPSLHLKYYFLKVVISRYYQRSYGMRNRGSAFLQTCVRGCIVGQSQVVAYALARTLE